MIDRRNFLAGLPLALAGCAGVPAAEPIAYAPPDPAEILWREIYAAVPGEPYPVEAIDLARIVDRRFLRRRVDYASREHPGTIVVDPNERFAYLIEENGKALRYGVGVGKVESFNFQGEAVIARKAHWPRWTPTPEMIAREPDRYGPLAGGLPGGPGNPLGPRALYFFRDGRDTLYRLHGTVEPWSIGRKVSSGCIRLLNQDIIDLHRRVPVGSKAVVLPIRPPATA